MTLRRRKPRFVELRHGEQQWEREHGACATVRGGQMYCHGYGVPRVGEKADVIGLGMKGRIWLTKVSRVRSSVWKVGGKRPGYNASDSESDELEEDS
ncbi:hypothetical protein JHK84_051058 [Glycine max]|nr:hypothetical protein JHK84_051058 [Glycine max]